MFLSTNPNLAVSFENNLWKQQKGMMNRPKLFLFLSVYNLRKPDSPGISHQKNITAQHISIISPASLSSN